MPGGGGGGAVPDPKMFSEPQNGKENVFGLLGGSGGMFSRKMFKIKGPKLVKNAFPEISAFKNYIKICQHVALLLNLGFSKNCLLALGGGQFPLPPSR